MIVLDASFIVALFDARDEHHARAAELLPAIRGSQAVCDLAASEVLTLSKNKLGEQRTRGVAAFLFGTQNVGVLFSDQALATAALDVFFKYAGMSFADASTVALMKRVGATHIVSFDSDFDYIPGVTRVH